MGLAIKIKKADDGNLCAVGNDMALFEFRYEPKVKAWLFWAHCNYNPIKKHGRDFPWADFIDICRTVAFIDHDEPLWDSKNITIISGKSYIR